MKRTFIPFLALLLLCSFTAVNLKPVDNDDAVTFVIKNFGINTKGSLNGLKGTLKWDAANPAASQINASVDVSTLNTGIDMRDKDLKEEKYFNLAKYPTINFTSTAVSATNITGNLTIKGTTKSISFPITVTPSGSGYLFQGEFTINRRDFDVGGSSMVLSDDVKVTLKVQANPM
ncbi:MAG TPA: YceI family protein [Chitinophagaceae bacterium]|nr:YceI family protein [Chitinophagaceae bacterium]